MRVLDAFTAGGAQQEGGRTSTELEWATNIDWAKGKHSVRLGALVEGGRFRSDSGPLLRKILDKPPEHG